MRRAWRADHTARLQLAVVCAAAFAPLGSTAAVAAPPVHPVHISTTQVALSADARQLVITVRVFTDDLEAGLGRDGKPAALRSASPTAVDSVLSAYLLDRVQLAIDGRAVMRPRFDGHVREAETMLCRLSLPTASIPTRLGVVQRVLVDTFDDQTNMVHVQLGAKSRSALLKQGNARADFTF
jgi:hypothetical protein